MFTALVEVRLGILRQLHAGVCKAGIGDEHATVIAAVFSVIGLPASVLGNELALRFGRRRVLIQIMTASAILAAVLGCTGGLPYLLVVTLILIYAVTLTADSGSLTAGAVAAASARPGRTWTRS